MAEGELKQPNKQPSKKGYGKRPIWFWVLLYIGIAVIVYALIYFIWFHHSVKGGTGGGY